jgi:NAD(P)-dependent dehydrogenase (short-subunit alcohol dehydrogenase family)
MTNSTHELAGKSALVIGGTTGIGAATVLALTARGCQVTFAGIERDAGRALEAGINAGTGGRALFVEIDVRHEAQVADLTQRAIGRFGQIHFAVNNAGVEGPFGPIQEALEADFDRIIGVNLKGLWLGMKYQIRHMLEAGGGVIVNTSSSAGLVSIPQVGIYSASKHAIIGLSKAAALEQARAGIRINVVAPGPVRTGLLARMVGGHISLDDIAERVPLGRISEPAEIAAAILWLCSDAASFVTGHTLSVDGGISIV